MQRLVAPRTGIGLSRGRRRSFHLRPWYPGNMVRRRQSRRVGVPLPATEHASDVTTVRPTECVEKCRCALWPAGWEPLFWAGHLGFVSAGRAGWEG